MERMINMALNNRCAFSVVIANYNAIILANNDSRNCTFSRFSKDLTNRN
jgi:hypothetical protein